MLNHCHPLDKFYHSLIHPFLHSIPENISQETLNISVPINETGVKQVVKSLLDLKIRNQSRCSDVLEKTNKKIIEINEKIEDLKKMKKSLDGLAKCCTSDDMPLSDCPILECF